MCACSNGGLKQVWTSAQAQADAQAAEKKRLEDAAKASATSVQNAFANASSR
jgi:hypothetical protein